MPSGIDNSGNYYYVKSGLTLSNTHGGHSEQHLREFEEVCNQIIDDKLRQLTDKLEDTIASTVEEYGRMVWTQLVESVVGALQTDVNSEVQIAFDNARDIFYGSKAQQYISDNVMKAMIKEIEKIKFTLK